MASKNVWQDSYGTAIGVSSARAFPNMIIPDGTIVPATISQANAIEEYPIPPEYQFYWHILDGDYKGREVRQKIQYRDKNPKRADKDKAVLVFLYDLFKRTLPIDHFPTDHEIKWLQGWVATIEIGAYEIPDKENPLKISRGNIIRSVSLLNPEHELYDAYMFEAAQFRLEEI